MIFTGCGNSAENAGNEENQEVVSDEEVVYDEEAVSDQETEDVEAEAAEGKENKDYDPIDYMEYEIRSTYFLKDESRGYELVIAQGKEYVRDVKIFVSQLKEDVYCLSQVLEDTKHDGDAWDNQGLYLVDVNFDGEKDILVQNGHYGNQGAQSYSCYLYEDGEYVYCEGFEEIPNVSVDEENRMILSSWRNSAASHGWGVWVYENGTFHLQRSLTEEYRENEGNEGKQVVYWTDEEFSDTVWTLQDSEGKGTIIDQFNDLACDEEVLNEKLYGKSGFWKLNDYYRWNSLEKIIPGEGDYFTDKLVLLGEYPIDKSLGGSDGKTILLYGVREKAPNSVILQIGEEHYQIHWYWGNNYETAPELICKDLDQDGKAEIVMKALNLTGTGWWVESLCICDLENGDMEAYVLEQADILEQIQDQIDYIYIKSENSVQFLQGENVIYEAVLPDWTEEYPYEGEVTYDQQIRFDPENMKMEVKPQIQLENSLPYEKIIMEFDIGFDEGKFSLKYSSVREES